MANAAKLKKLKLFRSTCFNDMSSLLTLANRVKTDNSLQSLFKARYSEIDEIRDQFLEHNQNIISILLADDTAIVEAEETIREGFLSDFFSVKAIYMDLFESSEVNVNASHQSLNRSISAGYIPQARLPKLEIPKFKGDYKEFTTFIDLFNALVHNNPSLSNIERFNYLISLLEDQPLSLVRTLPLTDDNYVTAYETLTKRYSNTRLRAQEHWAALENCPRASYENPSSLRSLLDTFSENLSALKILKFPTEHWDFIIVMMLFKRLDKSLITKFELEHGSSTIPTQKDLTDFLEKICLAFNTANFSTVPDRTRKPTKPERRSSYFGRQSSLKCPLCKNNHALYSCTQFLSKSPFERFTFCKNLHLCFNCLSNLHDIKTCHSSSSCKTCKQRHHTLLHFSKTVAPQTSSNNVETNANLSHHEFVREESTPYNEQNLVSGPQPSINVLNNTLSATGVTGEGVLLSTASIDVLDNRGMPQTFRCLLDSGSMTSFISLKAANRLGLPKQECSLEINGIGSMRSNFNNGSVSLAVKPVGQDGPTLLTDAVILNKICDQLPATSLSPESWSHIKNLKLADKHFYRPGRIDILLGSDLFSKIILNGRISGNGNEPDALNTIFGYVLMGRFTSPDLSQVTALFCTSLESNLDSTLRSFWEIETVPNVISASPDDNLCEQTFVEEHTRDKSGRYIVSLPFRDNEPDFSGMRDLAKNRFYSLERKLLQNKQIYTQYKDFMQEYLDLKHMEIVPASELKNPSYYLPHHCVLKPESQTTKLRVVFNGSAKLPNKTSLNDHLLVGPKLQKDIASILLTFRIYPYVICADIKQMYRMILINSTHRDYQRIIWRFSPDEPLQDYRLTTVTYGISSAPFLALRTLDQLVHDEGDAFPLASHALKTLTYIDDVSAGCFSLDEALKLQNELISLLRKGGFELRKWASNEPSLLRHLNPDHLSTDLRSFDFDSQNANVKVLGLQWNPVQDCFCFSINVEDRPCTKRILLSELARVFDPLGFLAPVTFFTKSLIQKLWSCGLEWDEKPPPDLVRVWTQYKQQLSDLNQLSVPRLTYINSDCSYELHGFCDASEKGYAAVIYLRFLYNGSVCTKFICSKTKVAPLSKITIPRLELCAAVLLAKLTTFVLNNYKNSITIIKIYAWTDSEIVLYWLKSSPHRWKTFVSNRVAYIQEHIAPSLWFHVRSGENPADIASRGLLPNKLLSNSMWFNGPGFLSNFDISNQAEHSNFNSSLAPSQVFIEEKRMTLFNKLDQNSDYLHSLLTKYSSFSQLQRVLTWMLRFNNNAKTKHDKNMGLLTTKELDNALLLLVKYSQQKYFANEIHGDVFSKPLRKLNIFIDSYGILRVGGRLQFSSLNYDGKHPILLSRKCTLTTLLIDFYHKKYLHAGLRTLQFLISQKFWILSPRRAITSVISRCITCWKTKPTPYQPPMGNLPPSRILAAKCFLNTGVDYAGPYLVTFGRHRGVRTNKAYICLFVCMATKAIHLELASDMSSETFLAALQRFISRRGVCNHLFSDQGTNFKAASKELDNFMRQAALKEGIEWSFSPPSAPHFGGLWESGVKAVKTHLNRVIGQQILTYEEFYTVLTLIESVLNSRPLLPMSADVEDVNALTPGHFLTMEPLSALPIPDYSNVPINRLSRWQLLQRLHRDFWDRWHKEYLHSLQQRAKWLNPMIAPKIGTLVMIKTDNALPCHWSLARIVSLHPGSDGVARVATIKTKNGMLKRPLVKLCPLPIDN